MQSEDAILAMRIKNERCEESFDRLFKKYKKLVHWKCYQSLFNAEDAEDATQETFSVFWHKASKRWDGRSVRAYLCKIAEYEASHMKISRSRKKRSGEMVYLDAVDADGNTPQLADPRSEYLTSREDEVEAEIDRVLIKLPATEAACRLAWVLMHREGYDRKEVAAIMGVKWQKVTVLLSRAETFIKASLREFYSRLIANDADWLEYRSQFRRLFEMDNDY